MPTISANVGTNERKVLTLKTKDKYCTDNITINVDGPIVSGQELFLEDRVVTLATPGEIFYGGDSVLTFKEGDSYTSSYFTSTSLIWKAKASLTINVVGEAYKSYSTPGGTQWIYDKDLVTTVTLAANTIFRTVSYAITTTPGYQNNNGVVTWKYETWDTTNNVWVSHTATRGSIYNRPSDGVRKGNSAAVVTGTFEREDNTALRSITVNVNNANYTTSLYTSSSYASGDIQRNGTYGYVTVSSPTITIKTSSAGWLAAGNVNKTASGSMNVYIPNNTIVKYAKQYITPITNLKVNMSAYTSMWEYSRSMSLTKNQCWVSDYSGSNGYKNIYFSGTGTPDPTDEDTYTAVHSLHSGNTTALIYYAENIGWYFAPKMTNSQDYNRYALDIRSNTLYFTVDPDSTPINYFVFTADFNATI